MRVELKMIVHDIHGKKSIKDYTLTTFQICTRLKLPYFNPTYCTYLPILRIYAGLSSLKYFTFQKST